MIYGRVRSDLKDVDGGLVDGADDGAARVDDIAHGPHHDCRRPGIQACHGIRIVTQIFGMITACTSNEIGHTNSRDMGFCLNAPKTPPAR